MSLYNENLLWRYATKKFDPTKKLTPKLLDELLEAPYWSASSIGLQPWKFVVVTNPELRQKLRLAGNNQPQFTDASHLVIFCVRKTMDEAYVDHYLARISEVRGQTMESLMDFKRMLLGPLRLSPAELGSWMRRQVYIALGFLLSSAAQHRVDACPMEGFDSKKFDEILELDQFGVESLATCALGYRSPDDTLAEEKKVRLPKEEIFVFK